MSTVTETGKLRGRIEVLEQALSMIASPLLDADIDEIRREAREALTQSRLIANTLADKGARSKQHRAAEDL